MTTIEQILMIVEQLAPEKQRQVLDYARKLSSPKLASEKLPPGTPGIDLNRLAMSHNIPIEDIEAMERALEDCERIEPDENKLFLEKSEQW